MKHWNIVIGRVFLNAKAFCRQHNNKDKNAPSPDRADADESGESEKELDDCARLAFNIVVSEEDPVNKNLLLKNKEEEMALLMQIRNMKESRLIGFNANPDVEIHVLKMNLSMKQMIKHVFASICGVLIWKYI